MKSKLLIALGILFLMLGAIGIFLPILPTTPFVLAAAGCFSGSSARLSVWLHKSRLFSDYITNYKRRTGLKKRTILISLVFLWTMLGISIVSIRSLWATILMPCIGVAVTVHILYMSLPKNTARKAKILAEADPADSPVSKTDVEARMSSSDRVSPSARAR